MSYTNDKQAGFLYSNSLITMKVQEEAVFISQFQLNLYHLRIVRVIAEYCSKI